MSEFLDRHKKKGLWALLLLFFTRGKGIGPLLLLVALLSVIFVLPSGLRMNFTWPDRLAARLGLRPAGDSGGPGLAEISEALRIARASRPAGLGGLFGRGVGWAPGRSSVDLVTGKRDAAGRDSPGAVERALQGGKSVQSIVNPEDGRKLNQGVALSQDELENGLLNSAHAGIISGAGAPGGAGAGDAGGLLAAVAGGPGGAGALGGPGVSDTGPAVTGAREGLRKGSAVAPGDALASKMPAVAGDGKAPKGAAGGKVSSYGWSNLKHRISSALQLPKTNPKATAMYQLAETRAYSVVAAPGPSACNDPSCPREYASNVAGNSFDAGKPIESVMTVPEINEPVPVTPDMNNVNTMIGEAEGMESDAKKCEESERYYGPKERAKMAEIQKFSDELTRMNCNGGSCSRGRVEACKRKGNEMRRACGQYNSIAAQKATDPDHGCPLMNGQYSQMNCNQ